MKPSYKHTTGNKDDSLFGLLSSHKSSYTYIRILVSQEEDSVLVQLTDNPGNFPPLADFRNRNYRQLRRLDIGATKISLKYVNPRQLVGVLGPVLEFNVSPDKVVITDGLNSTGVYTIETSMKYKLKVIQGARKLLHMSPQKRYEILERYISGEQE